MITILNILKEFPAICVCACVRHSSCRWRLLVRGGSGHPKHFPCNKMQARMSSGSGHSLFSSGSPGRSKFSISGLLLCLHILPDCSCSMKLGHQIGSDVCDCTCMSVYIYTRILAESVNVLCSQVSLHLDLACNW